VTWSNEYASSGASKSRAPKAGAEMIRFVVMAKRKNPAAVALGRLGGGPKGGKARMAQLTAEQRRELAKKAARARWRKEL